MGDLRVGIAGLGTVGGGVLKLLHQQAELLAQRCGKRIAVAAVSARDKTKDRGADLKSARWHADPVALANDPAVDVVVELIGGADGPAKKLCEAAIAQGKPVVTANKALLAVHGVALARAAEARGVVLAFEAAVAGGIPIVKALREGLAGNSVLRVYGILNGTCNYILTTMREKKREFADVLAEAQKLGYAELDPATDVDGIDAAHKLALLAALAYGSEIDLKSVHVEGIRHVSAQDIDFAGELGYRIKLIGQARMTEHGLEQRVTPAMVPLDSPIAHTEGVFNAVVVEGNFVGTTLFQGRGAGAGPTASAVVADLIDIARGRQAVTFSVPAAKLRKIPASPMARHRGAYYIRLMVKDRPGVIADVTAALRDEQVSLESMLQRGRAVEEAVPVVLITHETEEAGMFRALARIEKLDTVREKPRVIRIEPSEGK